MNHLSVLLMSFLLNSLLEKSTFTNLTAFDRDLKKNALRWEDYEARRLVMMQLFTGLLQFSSLVSILLN